MTNITLLRPVVPGEYERSLIGGGHALGQFDLSALPATDRDALTSFCSGGFVDAGENIVIVGGFHIGQEDLARTIARAVAAQGKTVRIIDGNDAEPQPGSDMALCDLLVVNEVPQVRGGRRTLDERWVEKHCGEKLADLLEMRLANELSTIVTSRRGPRDWIRHESFGLGSQRRIAQLHMGVASEPDDPFRFAVMDRILVPGEGEGQDAARQRFVDLGVAPFNWVRSSELLTEYFGVTLPDKTWHWVHLTRPVELA